MENIGQFVKKKKVAVLIFFAACILIIAPRESATSPPIWISLNFWEQKFLILNGFICDTIAVRKN